MRKIYQSFRQFSFVFGLTLFASNAQAIDCTPTPDCSALGYTKTQADCQGADMILKCPTDTSKMSCWINVQIGDILYGDGSVSREVVAGKTPIGVVFDVENHLAVALTDVKLDGSAGSGGMPWSSSNCDVPNLENCTDYNAALTSCGIDGRTNTDAILATNGGCSGTTYAANAVNSYFPTGCSALFCGRGKWFLPSQRDLYIISSFFSEINNTFTLLNSLGASSLLEDMYWSSTEYSADIAWDSYVSGYSLSNKYASIRVRPVVKF